MRAALGALAHLGKMAPKRARPVASGLATSTKKPKAGEDDGDGTSGLWLVKSEPDEFSLDDLRASHGGVAQWDGVRNAQARNLMKTMRVGDRAFFYHSSCKVPAVVGICEIVKAAYPDPTALDPKAPGFDPKSTPTNNRWLCVDVEFIRAMSRTVTLSELRREAAGDGVTGEDGAKALASMTLLNRPRLSVQRVTRVEWEHVLRLETTSND